MKSTRLMKPRNGRTLQVLIVGRISGCQNQQDVSLDDQVAHGKQATADIYDGLCNFHTICTTGKGERLDRPELAEVEAGICSGAYDLIVMEDVGRMVRGTAAVAIWGMAVDKGIRCIAPHDGCDTYNPTWEVDLISACKDHVSHCEHTSRRIKNKQMNRFRSKGGAIPQTVSGYIKPEGAKFYSELRKDENVSPFFKEGLVILRRTRSWTAVAEYFNRYQVPLGPHCRRTTWDGAMVRRLYHNPILKGRPQRGEKHSVKINETGRRISVVNPDGPIYRDEPHLAHFDAVELDTVLAEVDAAHAALGRPKDPTDGRVRNNRKRTRFPGQCATCLYCGRELVWGGNGIQDHLMCNGSRDYQCWASRGVSGTIAAERVLEAIINELAQLEGFNDQFAEIVRQAQAEWEHDRSGWQDLQAAETKLQQDRDRLKHSILQTGPHEFLHEMLVELESRERELARRREMLDKHMQQRPQIPSTVAELRSQFEEVARDLVSHSFEFGDLLRSMVTEFHVYYVRLIDGQQLFPRAKVTLSLGAIVRDIDRTPSLQEFLTREVTIDLFKTPTREEIREEAVRQVAAGTKPRDIAASLKTYLATVQHALKLDRMMRDRGLTSPYELVTEPPPAAGNKKMKRCRNEKYSFKPREGYEPPAL